MTRDREDSGLRMHDSSGVQKIQGLKASKHTDTAQGLVEIITHESGTK